jgi:Uma2 family endonuclease
MQQRVEIPKLTYEDYCALPDDGKRYEIIDGELYVTRSPMTKHQRASRNLMFRIHAYLQAHPIGEVFSAPFDVILDEHTIVVPDLVFVRNENRHILLKENIRGSPDLVVEILSPSTRRKDRFLKLRAFAAHGVVHYWLVDPETEMLEALVLEGGSYRIASTCDAKSLFEPSLFPGLRIPIGDLFK